MGMMLFPVHWGLGIAPNIEQSVVKVQTLPLISRLETVSSERFALLNLV
jgi:hypothetical protein